jgi:hypothetical protein
MLTQTLDEPTSVAQESIEPEWQSWPADGDVRLRVAAPSFRYTGTRDPHWQGQPCHVDPRPRTDAGERVVTMACGCRASVPWWTLEPVS